MAVSVTVPGTVYNTQTAAGAHAMMVAIRDGMDDVGLTPASFTGAYDPDGADTQMSTTLDAQSAWMAFNFTDSDQSAHPITVWFGFIRKQAHTNNVLGFLPCFRISEGVDGSGNPLGRYVENIPSSVNYVNNQTADSYQLKLRSSSGDFFRYTGDSLTVIFGALGFYTTFDSHTSGDAASVFELHIERMRSAVDGTTQDGFVGLAQPCRQAPSTHFASLLPTGTNCLYRAYIPSTPLCFININNLTAPAGAGHQFRAGGIVGESDYSTPVVAPIYYRDASGRLNTLQRLFTLPRASLTNLTTISLDFSGAEEAYLTYWSGASVGYTGVSEQLSPVALLIEWE